MYEIDEIDENVCSGCGEYNDVDCVDFYCENCNGGIMYHKNNQTCIGVIWIQCKDCICKKCIKSEHVYCPNCQKNNKELYDIIIDNNYYICDEEIYDEQNKQVNLSLYCCE